MIEKIISIQNIGRFIDYNVKPENGWNGSFSKVNIIYAPNGFGKTTLATILKSLAQNEPQLIEFKESFNSQSQPYISIKVKGVPGVIEFKDNKWSRSLPNLEIFDIHFIEDYLFVGSILSKKHKTNLFKLLLNEEGLKLRSECKALITKKINSENRLKKQKTKNEEAKITSIGLEKLNSDLSTALGKYYSYSKPIFDQQIVLTNKYLRGFAPYIVLEEFSHQKDSTLFETFRIFITLKVHGQRVQFLAPDIHRKQPNAKFTLSEGDKSAFAVSFFLAAIERIGYNGKIIIFDDPISSFDYNRKNATISTLARLCNEISQFFLLTHDIFFAKEFTEKMKFENCLNLKLANNGTTSYLVKHEIFVETLNGIQKDLLTVKKYLAEGANKEIELREVIRCIRPILEGHFKLKYFDTIQNNHWLGDIINQIRESDNASRLFRLKKLLPELIELNDYCKQYHHSSFDSTSDIVNPVELKQYIDLLLKTIDEI